MSLYQTLSRLGAEWRTARDETRTRRVLAGLPSEVLKDIGWPDSDRGAQHRYRTYGSWVAGR